MVSDLTAKAGGIGSSQRCVFTVGELQVPFQGDIIARWFGWLTVQPLGRAYSAQRTLGSRRPFYPADAFPPEPVQRPGSQGARSACPLGRTVSHEGVPWALPV
jgi:hypothetical protein